MNEIFKNEIKRIFGEGVLLQIFTYHYKKRNFTNIEIHREEFNKICFLMCKKSKKLLLEEKENIITSFSQLEFSLEESKLIFENCLLLKEYEDFKERK